MPHCSAIPTGRVKGIRHIHSLLFMILKASHCFQIAILYHLLFSITTAPSIMLFLKVINFKITPSFLKEYNSCCEKNRANMKVIIRLYSIIASSTISLQSHLLHWNQPHSFANVIWYHYSQTCHIFMQYLHEYIWLFYDQWQNLYSVTL